MSHSDICTVQIGRMAFLLECRFDGVRFVAMGVHGDDGRISVVCDQAKRRELQKAASERNATRRARLHR